MPETASFSLGIHSKCEFTMQNMAVPLENKWKFWTSSMKGDPDLRCLEEFENIQDFWELFKIHPVGDIPDKTYLHVFKNDITPLWEDPKNLVGGHFKLTARTQQQSETLWMSVVLNLLGEQFPNGELLNGASVMANQVGNNLVKVWFASTERSKIQEIRDFFRKILSDSDYLAGSVTFVPHKLVVKGAGKKISERVAEKMSKSPFPNVASPKRVTPSPVVVVPDPEPVRRISSTESEPSESCSISECSSVCSSDSGDLSKDLSDFSPFSRAGCGPSPGSPDSSFLQLPTNSYRAFRQRKRDQYTELSELTLPCLSLSVLPPTSRCGSHSPYSVSPRSDASADYALSSLHSCSASVGPSSASVSPRSHFDGEWEDSFGFASARPVSHGFGLTSPYAEVQYCGNANGGYVHNPYGAYSLSVIPPEA